MKRGIAFALSALLLMGGMTGCGHEHEWQDATCTTPKTCAICGETEGEALGHDWDLSEDRPQCLRCSETRDGTLEEVKENYLDKEEIDGLEIAISGTKLEITCDNFNDSAGEDRDTFQNCFDVVSESIEAFGYLNSQARTLLDSIAEPASRNNDYFIDVSNKVENYCGDNVDEITIKINMSGIEFYEIKNGVVTYDLLEQKYGSYSYHYYY